MFTVYTQGRPNARATKDAIIISRRLLDVEVAERLEKAWEMAKAKGYGAFMTMCVSMAAIEIAKEVEARTRPNTGF